MHRDRQQRPPDRRQDGEPGAGAAVDPEEVRRADRQNVAEEVGQQVDPQALEEAERHQAEGQAGMGHQPQQRVAGDPLLLLHGDEEGGQQQRARDYADRQVKAQEKAQDNAQQGIVGQAVAEVGHAPPDDEATEGARE